MKKLLLLFVAIIFAANSITLYAADADYVVNNVDGIPVYYKYVQEYNAGYFIVGSTDAQDRGNLYSGDIAIPDVITPAGLETTNITEISPYAFNKCKDLYSVTIDAYNLTKVCENAFFDCPNLHTIHFSNYVNQNLKIEVGFFKNCPSLKRIIIDNSCPEIVVLDNNKEEFVKEFMEEKIKVYINADSDYDFWFNSFWGQIYDDCIVIGIPEKLTKVFSFISNKKEISTININTINEISIVSLTPFLESKLSQGFNEFNISSENYTFFSNVPEAIEGIVLKDAGVTGFNGEKLTGLKTLDLSGNNLTFASEVVVPDGCKIIADNQAIIPIIADGVTVDLSNYVDSANIVWKKGEDAVPATDYQQSNGKYFFTKNYEGIHAELTDKNRDWLKLCTSAVTIDDVEEDVVSLKYELFKPGIIHVTVSAPTIVNGENIIETGDIVLPAGNEFTLTANHPENIVGLKINGVGLTDFVIISLQKLKSLDVSDNSLCFDILDKALPDDCKLTADNQKKIGISVVGNSVDLSDYGEGFTVRWLKSNGEEITAYDADGGKYSFAANYDNIHAEISKGGLKISTTDISINSVESTAATLTYELSESKTITISTNQPTLINGKEINEEGTIDLPAVSEFTLTANHPENIIRLDLSGIGLTAIEIENLPGLKALDVSDNALTFETMPTVPEGCKVTYGTQEPVEIKANGAVVDLSKYADATIVWKQGETVVSADKYTINNGVYAFTENLEGIIAEISKGGMTLTTTAVSINTLESLAATLTCELKEPKLITIKTSAPTLVNGKEIDGEGSIELPAGSEFTLTANHPENIIGLDVSGIGLTAIEIENLPGLKALDVSDNALTFETMPTVPEGCKVTYGTQKPVEIKANGATVDLSKYADATIVWKQGETVVSADKYTINNGVYTFTENLEGIHAELTKGELTLTTTKISINTLESLAATLTCELKEPKLITIKTSAPTLVNGKEIDGEGSIEIPDGISFALTANHPENIIGLDVSGIGLIAIEIENLPGLKTLDVSDNALTFETMPTVPEGYSVTYGTQEPVEIKANGATVDLSKYADATIVWKQGETVVSADKYTINNGVYAFTENLEGIHAELTKGELTLTTTKISINTLESTAAALAYELAEPKTISVTTNQPTLVNGKEINGEGTIDLSAGSEFTLTANHPENIIGLDLSGIGLTRIDLADLPKLKALNLNDNALDIEAPLPILPKDCDVTANNQKSIEIEAVGASVDLSKYQDAKIVWKQNYITVNDYTVKDGIYTFKKNFAGLHAELTKSWLAVKTSEITIDVVESDVAAISYHLDEPGIIIYTLSAPTIINGVEMSGTAKAVLPAGESYLLTANHPENIAELSLRNIGLREMAVFRLPNMKKLDLSENELGFESLPIIPEECEVIADNQKPLEIRADGANIDMTPYYLDAKISWMLCDEPFNDFDLKSGVYTFFDNLEGLYAVVTRDWLTRTTVPVTIDIFSYEAAELSYALDAPGEIGITTSGPTVINDKEVDGKGVITLPAGKKLTLTTNHPERIIGLTIKGIGLTHLEAKHMPSFQKLTLYGDDLSFDHLPVIPSGCNVEIENERTITIGVDGVAVDLSAYPGVTVTWTDGENEIDGYEESEGIYTFTQDYDGIYALLSKDWLTMKTSPISVRVSETPVAGLTYSRTEPGEIRVTTSAPTLICGTYVNGEATISIPAGEGYTLAANFPENVKELDVAGIGLTDIDIIDLPALVSIDLSGNALDFDHIPDLPETCMRIQAADQSPIELVADGATIDLSDYLGHIIEWHDADHRQLSDEHYEHTDGMYTFLTSHSSLHAHITHASYPWLTLTTVPIDVTATQLIKIIKNGVRIEVANRKIHIFGDYYQLSLHDLSGRRISEPLDRELPPGVYILQIDRLRQKLLIK